MGRREVFDTFRFDLKEPPGRVLIERCRRDDKDMRVTSVEESNAKSVWMAPSPYLRLVTQVLILTAISIDEPAKLELLELREPNVFGTG
jgi:hypothetical protein